MIDWERIAMIEKIEARLREIGASYDDPGWRGPEGLAPGEDSIEVHDLENGHVRLAEGCSDSCWEGPPGEALELVNHANNWQEVWDLSLCAFPSHGDTRDEPGEPGV